MTPPPLSGLRAVVFDFDLTLVDSREGFILCYQHAARELGLPVPTWEQIGPMIGTPIPIVFRQLFGDEHAELVDEYVRLYQAKADEVMTEMTHPLPGAGETLRWLHEDGIKLAILSQKLRIRVEAVLKREQWLEYFDVILGGEDVPALKPDPRGLLAAIASLGLTIEETIYVGDTLIDAETAVGAGVAFVGVLSGFVSQEQFSEYGPAAVLSSVVELRRLLGLTDQI